MIFDMDMIGYDRTVMLVVVVENMVLKVLFLDRGVEYVLIDQTKKDTTTTVLY